MSPQASYAQDPARAVAGQLVDGMVHDVESYAAEEAIPFGLGLVRDPLVVDVVKLPGVNVHVATEDAGAHTSGGLSATINGVTVTVAYNANKATTWGDLATAIQALDFVLTSAYASNAVTTTAQPNVVMAASIDISAAVGGVTMTSQIGSLTDSFRGISMRDTREEGAFRNRNNDTVLLTLSNDALTTSDTVAANINGQTGTTVTYATSEAVTLQNLANTIITLKGVVNAVVAGRTITVTNNPGLLAEKATVTVVDNALGSVAPSFAATYSKQQAPIAVDATAYLPTETVSSLRKGRIFVQVEEAIVLTDSPFVRVSVGTGSQKGAFRKDIDSGSAVAATGVNFIGPSETAPDGTLVAPVELNLP